MSRSIRSIDQDSAAPETSPRRTRARFTGKNVFITGAGSGFGRRTAERFASEGAANLYLVDRRPERLEVVADVIEELGANPVSICVDLGQDPPAVSRRSIRPWRSTPASMC